MSEQKRRDLYDVLGVGPDADAAEIKYGYRDKAKRAHPDIAGGSSKAFSEVREAYLVLSDARRRAYYDATGEVFDALVGIDARAVSTMRTWLDMICGDDTKDPIALRVDIPRAIIELARVNILNAEAAKPTFEKKIKRWTNIRDRFRRKLRLGQLRPLPNFMALHLEGSIRQAKRMLFDLDEQIAVLRRVIEIAGEFDYDVPLPPEVAGYQIISIHVP